MQVGSLLIDMAADVARLRADMTKATGIVDGAVKKMESAVSALKSSIAGLAAGLTVAAFAGAIKHQLELADAMSKTAERTGLALKDVAGLQLAYKLAGLGADDLEKSVGKMAKAMADGNAAFDAMGVKTKNADGTLRSTRDVLADVADKFAGYKDGAEKTALAQELFGKSGTSMISVLNGGSAALDDMDAQARKLGLVLDDNATESAKKFNDALALLQEGGQGWMRQIAGGLAPTLASMAQELLSNANHSQSLSTVTDALKVALKGLYTVAVGGIQILVNTGRVLGALGAAFMAFVSGDFKGAGDIMKDAAATNRAAWESTADSIDRVWKDTSDKSTEALGTIIRKSKEAAPVVAKVADSASKVEGAYTSMMKVLSERLASANQELAMGRQLTDMEKFEVKIKTDLALAAGKLTEAQKQTILSTLADVKASTLALEVKKSLIEIEDRHRSALQDVAKAESSRIDDIAKSNTDLREQIAVMGLTNEQIRKRTIELNRATIAEKEQQLARLQSGYTNTREQAALEESIRALKERNELLSDQGAKEAQIAAQQEMLDMWQSVDRTAHDVFVNMSEDGEGTIKRLGKTLKASLWDMLYQLTVRKWIINIGVSMGATGGIFAAGNAAAGQGGSALGLLGNASSIAGNWGAISGWAGGGMSTANAAGSIFANATGTGIDGLLATNGAYGTAAGGGFMSGLATAAPWIAGGLLVANALGLFRTTERKGGGLIGTLGQAGGIHDVDLMRRDGSLFGGPDWFTEDLGVSKLDKIIQTQFDASKQAIKGFAETLGLATDKIDGFTTTLGKQTMCDHGQLGIRLDKDGKPLSDQEVQAAIAEAIKAGSNELAQQLIGTWTESIEQVTRDVVQTTGGEGDTGWNVSQVTEDVTRRTYKPSEFARDGEQAIDTLTRLATSLGTVNGIFDTLGLTLYETSMKGGDLASQLADAAGGLDKLQAASANYYQNFYSAAEQHDIALRQLGKQFEALGVVMPATRDEFRHLVESLDLTTEGGRTTFAALMNLSGSFAAVVPAVEEISSSTSEMGRAMGDAARATEDLAAMARKAEDEARRASERAAQDAAQAIVKAAQDAASAASEAARKASEAHSKASAMTDRVFAELRKQFDKALQAARTMVDTAQAIAQMTGERSRALYGEIPESRQYGAAAGNAFIDDALRTMLQGGAMPKTDELSRAIDSAVAGLDVNNYASVAQFQADKAILAAKLGAMEKVAGKQLTEGEQQVELLQQQLEHWDEQLSVLRDTQVSVTSIDDGVRQLSGLMAAESAAAGAAREAQDRYAQASLALQQAQQAQQGAAQQPGSIAGAYNSAVANIRAASWYGNGDWGEARGLKLSELSTAIGVDAGDLARLLVQQGLSLHGDLITTRDAYGDHDAEAAAIRAAKWYGSGNWDDARGSSLIGLAKSMGVDPVDLERRLIAEGMQVSADGIVLSKRYAQGGLHSGGWRLVGEQGPEVEFTGPARYWSFDQSRSMLSGGGGGNEELVAENRALRAKVDELIARIDRVAAATEMSARLMDRVTANGNAMRTEAA